jgi:hypothetical protein
MRQLIIIITLILIPARMVCGAELTKNAPNEHTPPKLINAWVRFHESELCQNADAVFIFDDRGMEAWYVSKDDGIYQKLRDLFQTQDGSYRVELYPTHKRAEKKAREDESSPPPSLYMNSELRKNLMGNPDFPSSNETAGNKRITEYGKWTIETRLIVYAEQVLECNRKINRYAMDLPLLVRVASDPATAPGTRSMAIAACNAHAQNLGKNLSKLETNLKLALPRSDNKKRSSKAGKPGKVVINPAESAEQISEAAQKIVRNINKFIYPEQHAVTVSELFQPSLLEDLRSLKAMVLDFPKALPSASAGKPPARKKINEPKR